MAMGRSNFALAQFLLARQARTSRLHFTAALKLIVSSQTVVFVLEFYKVDILIFNFYKKVSQVVLLQACLSDAWLCPVLQLHHQQP